jgi:hypothetical protein
VFNPEVTVSAEHPMGVDRAPAVEAVDNYFIRKLKLRNHINRAAQHSYLYHRAILKIGYDSEFGWSPRLDIGGPQNPAGMTFSQFHRTKKNRIEYKNITPGMPWVSAVMPHDIVVPWGVYDIEDAPWVAHRVVRLTEDLKEDRKYKNTSRLQPNMTIADFVYTYLNVGVDRKRFREANTRATFMEAPKPIYNEIWEIHDRRTMTIKVVCRDCNEFLRDEIDALGLVCNTVFVSSTFTPHPRTFWGTPLAYYLGQIQETQFDISKQSEKQRRINNLKFIASKSLMSEEELTKLIGGDVGAVAMAETPEPLRDKLMAFPQGNQLDFVMQSDANRRDARDAIGMSRNQGGEYDTSSRRTAREATFVQQGSQRRESLRVSAVRDLYLDTITKLNQVSFAYWRKPRYVMIGKEFVQFTGEELRGDYLYDLSLSTKRELSKAERKAEAMMVAMQMMQMLPVNNPDALIGFLTDAANDPGFEKLIGMVKGGGRGGGAGGLPTIPGTGGQG